MLYGNDPESRAGCSWKRLQCLRLLSRWYDPLIERLPLVQKGGVFSPLQDMNFFRERLTVINDTVAWDVDGTRDPCTCVDLDPCELYETCPVVEDPLKDVG